MDDSNSRTDLHLTAQIKLYYDLHVPENLSENSPLLVAVHGYGAHKRYMMREARHIAPNNFIVVSLQAPHQHFRQTESGYKVGFGWLTDYKPEESVRMHQKFVSDIIEKMSDEYSIDRSKIFLYGFSQACALNFRFAFTQPEILRGIVGVCGGIPSDLETNENYQATKAETFYLYANCDEFYPLEKYRAYDEKLKNFLPGYQSKLYEAAHEITNEMREDLKNWLAAF